MSGSQGIGGPYGDQLKVTKRTKMKSCNLNCICFILFYPIIGQARSELGRAPDW